MTEIPEHLLRRSKERRAALGLGGEGGGGEEAPATPAAPASSPSTEVAATPAAPAAAAPAPAAPAAPPPAPPPPPYVVAAQNRRKIPFWAVPVLAVLPIWGFVYAGSLATPEEEITDPELVLGEEVYANCAGCHGGNGEGGAGRPLSDGDVLLTFPDIDDHIAWVAEGSALVGGAGNPYGDPDRPGGQRVSGADGFGQMAGWGGQLTEDEIRAVVRYEREVLSGGAPEGGEAAAGGEGEGATDDGGAAANDGGEAGEVGEGEDLGGTDGATDG